MNLFIAKIIDDKGILDDEESWHCSKVLRFKIGDSVKLIDGYGNFYDGFLELVSEKKCIVKLNSNIISQFKKNYFIHLAIAPTKQIDRIEWMIEKAVEIGINEISFMVCHNSERKVVKIERLKKIIESSVKQSMQAFIPKINEVVTFKKIIQSSDADQKLIAHCSIGEKTNFKDIVFKNKNSLILIGPEGDFTSEEIKEANEKDFKSISLGDNRLRTETAGLFVCQAAAILS